MFVLTCHCGDTTGSPADPVETAGVPMPSDCRCPRGSGYIRLGPGVPDMSFDGTIYGRRIPRIPIGMQRSSAVAFEAGSSWEAQQTSPRAVGISLVRRPKLTAADRLRMQPGPFRLGDCFASRDNQNRRSTKVERLLFFRARYPAESQFKNALTQFYILRYLQPSH